MTPSSPSPRLPWALALLLACVSLLHPWPVRGQEGNREDRQRALLAGTHVFRRILHDHQMKPLTGYEDLLNEGPRRCILIVLGDFDEITGLRNGLDLERFVRAGGAVLAASDRRPLTDQARSQLAAVAGVEIGPDTFVCENPTHRYLNFPYCPILKPVPEAKPALFQHTVEMFEGGPLAAITMKVATNVPSCLIPVTGFPGKVRPLAMLPEGSVQDRRMHTPASERLFAVGGEVGDGRVLVLADHSLFINEMMLPTDNQNVEFTSNCVNWLRDKNRDRVLFVEDGNFQTNFNIPLKSPNLPLKEAFKMIFDRRNELLVEFEKGAVRLENDNFFNGKLIEVLRNHGLPPPRVMLYFAIFGTLAMLMYGVWRLGVRQRFRHDTSAPLLAAEVGRTLPVQPLLAQRTDALVVRGNLWEPAALLVRRWFARLGVEGEEEKAPLFMVQGSWWERRKLLARLRQLWSLADGRHPERVTAPRMWRLQRELDELRASWERGVWGVSKKEEGFGRRDEG